jgi:hypothetical protein
MASLGEATLVFSADDRPFQQAASRVDRDMRNLADRMGTTGDGVEGMILKFGKLSLASTAAKHVGQALEEMTVKFRTGQASVGELVSEMAKGIPVLGGFVEGLLGVAEAITGDKAALEQLKLQTAEIEKQIELVAKLTKTHEDLGQTKRNQQRDVAIGLAGQNLPAAAAAIFGIGGDPEATANHIRQQVRAQFAARFKAIDDEKTALGEKIRHSGETLLEGGHFDPEAQATFQRQFDEAEKRADQLRRDVTAAEDAALAKIGNGAFVQLGKLAGGDVAKGFDKAGAALQQFIKNIPVASRLTERLVETFNKLAQSHAGNIGQFLNERGALAFDKGRGAISPDLFQKLSDKSFFDQAARSVGSILQQYAPIAETIARLVDSNFGLSNFASKAAAAVGSVFPERINTREPREAREPAPFRASLVSLEDLGRRIQEGAGSDSGQTAEGIKKAVEASLVEQRRQTELLKKLKGPIG